MKDKAAVWVGALAIVGMGVLVGLLFPKAAAAPEEEWARLVYLLSGVEASSLRRGRVLLRARGQPGPS